MIWICIVLGLIGLGMILIVEDGEGGSCDVDDGGFGGSEA